MVLAAERRVSSSTHNQALSALQFFYREVPGEGLPWLDDLQRPSRPKRIPVAIAREEVSAMLSNMEEPMRLVGLWRYRLRVSANTRRWANSGGGSEHSRRPP